MTEQLENSTYYVLKCLKETKALIPQLNSLMRENRAKIEKQLSSNKDNAKDSYGELVKAHARLVNAIESSVLHLREIGETQLADHALALASQIKQFNLMTKDYSILSHVLEDYCKRLPEPSTTNAAVIGRCMNAVKMGFYPTDLDNVQHIMKGITFPEGITSNLLDPCCGEGKALKKLAVGNNCFTYGVELDEARGEKAQNELHRVAFGSFFHSRISREAFHIIFLNPPYLAVMNEGGSRSREERRFLIGSIPHLMTGGILVYIIQYYRLTPDICRVLCDNFSDISAHRFTEPEFDKYSQVAVIGKRITRIDGSEATEELAKLVLVPDTLPCITEIDAGRYHVPAVVKKVETFKGAVFNVAELQRQLKQSKSFDKVLADKKLEEGIRRPPLPFTFSQLGLIGGSGLINGLIECDSPHIIKGRIVKEVKTENIPSYSPSGALVSTEIRETVSNKMIFNILTPDGFKSLA